MAGTLSYWLMLTLKPQIDYITHSNKANYIEWLIFVNIIDVVAKYSGEFIRQSKNVFL